jgi:hypothetical protein
VHVRVCSLRHPECARLGYDVVCNRPKVAAYRAPGSPLGAYAVESALDVLAQKIGMDPLELRLKNAAKKGTQMLSGAKLGHDGYAETIKALINHPGYRAPLGKNQGRGVASGYWFNGGGESSATVHVNEDGIVLATGSPDIGGSRGSPSADQQLNWNSHADRLRRELLVPSPMGDAVGHWEGETLVIDTVGIKTNAFTAADMYGTPQSAAMHVIERYRLIDGALAKAAQDKSTS